MKIIFRLSFLSLAFIAWASAASANDMGHGGGAREACKSDTQKFCKDVQPGGGRIISCLKEHTKDLTDECRGGLQKMAMHHRPEGKMPEAPRGTTPSTLPTNETAPAPVPTMPSEGAAPGNTSEH